MDKATLQTLLQQIRGCTFANIDAETKPCPGIIKVTTGKRVILFSTKGGSGYEAQVKRRLAEAGKNPDDFTVGDLPWGQRIDNLPLIENKGKFYLQCIELAEGVSKYFIAVTMAEVDPQELGLRDDRTNQGLAVNAEVHVRCYNIENITRIALMGENIVTDRPNRSILRVGFKEANMT